MQLVKAHFPIMLVLLVVGATFWLLPQTVRASTPTQIPSCGGAKIFIEGGHPSPFILPDFAGQQLQVEPEAVLEIRGENIPDGARLNWGLQGFGTELASKELFIGSGTAQVKLEDISAHARGVFEIEGMLIAGSDVLCSVPFQVNISGFGGTTALAATGITAVAGLGALASAPLLANGLNAKANLKVQLRRRRLTGLGRWLPMPAWKRTIFSTITGLVTGVAITVILQQGGLAPLSIATAVKAAIIGGGATFGIGYSLCVLRTYIKPPVAEPEKGATVGTSERESAPTG